MHIGYQTSTNPVEIIKHCKTEKHVYIYTLDLNGVYAYA